MNIYFYARIESQKTFLGRFNQPRGDSYVKRHRKTGFQGGLQAKVTEEGTPTRNLIPWSWSPILCIIKANRVVDGYCYWRFFSYSDFVLETAIFPINSARTGTHKSSSSGKCFNCRPALIYITTFGIDYRAKYRSTFSQYWHGSH